jgi:hypothetical protein
MQQQQPDMKRRQQQQPPPPPQMHKADVSSIQQQHSSCHSQRQRLPYSSSYAHNSQKRAGSTVPTPSSTLSASAAAVVRHWLSLLLQARLLTLG